MKNKHKENKIKISIASLKNVKSLLEECNDVYCEYNRELEIALNHFKDFVDDSIDSQNGKPETKEIVSGLPSKNVYSHDHPQDDAVVNVTRSNRDVKPWVKKLYRAIMLKAHPDKLESSNMSRKNELKFLIASEDAISAMRDNNHLHLIEIGLDLNIKFDYPRDEILKEIDGEIKSRTSKISEIEKSIQWAWGEAYGNINLRVNIISALLENFKIKIENRVKIVDYIIKLERDETNPNRKAKLKRRTGQKPQKIIKRR